MDMICGTGFIVVLKRVVETDIIDQLAAVLMEEPTDIGIHPKNRLVNKTTNLVG